MKTIEEKAKAYDEALERAKKWAGKYIGDWKNGKFKLPFDNTGEIAKDYLNIFPELRESKDERIRRKLIDFFSGYNADKDWWGDITEEDILSYLEKQKEQKSLNIRAASEWLRKHVRNYMNSEYNEFHKCVEFDGSIDKERLVNDFEEAMQKEQKPAEKDSEEMFDKIDDSFRRGREVGFREGVESVKPTKWSEKDEKVYSRLLKHYENLTYCAATAARHQEIREELNFLKSRRPSWKPSEDQMKALRNSAYGTYQNGDGPGLRELYEQLKKLM